MLMVVELTSRRMKSTPTLSAPVVGAIITLWGVAAPVLPYSTCLSCLSATLEGLLSSESGEYSVPQVFREVFSGLGHLVTASLKEGASAALWFVASMISWLGKEFDQGLGRQLTGCCSQYSQVNFDQNTRQWLTGEVLTTRICELLECLFVVHNVMSRLARDLTMMMMMEPPGVGTSSHLVLQQLIDLVGMGVQAPCMEGHPLHMLAPAAVMAAGLLEGMLGGEQQRRGSKAAVEAEVRQLTQVITSACREAWATASPYGGAYTTPQELGCALLKEGPVWPEGSALEGSETTSVLGQQAVVDDRVMQSGRSPSPLDLRSLVVSGCGVAYASLYSMHLPDSWFSPSLEGWLCTTHLLFLQCLSLSSIFVAPMVGMSVEQTAQAVADHGQRSLHQHLTSTAVCVANIPQNKSGPPRATGFPATSIPSSGVGTPEVPRDTGRSRAQVGVTTNTPVSLVLALLQGSSIIEEAAGKVGSGYSHWNSLQDRVTATLPPTVLTGLRGYLDKCFVVTVSCIIQVRGAVKRLEVSAIDHEPPGEGGPSPGPLVPGCLDRILLSLTSALAHLQFCRLPLPQYSALLEDLVTALAAAGATLGPHLPDLLPPYDRLVSPVVSLLSASQQSTDRKQEWSGGPSLVLTEGTGVNTALDGGPSQQPEGPQFHPSGFVREGQQEGGQGGSSPCMDEHSEPAHLNLDLGVLGPDGVMGNTAYDTGPVCNLTPARAPQEPLQLNVDLPAWLVDPVAVSRVTFLFPLLPVVARRMTSLTDLLVATVPYLLLFSVHPTRAVSQVANTVYSALVSRAAEQGALQVVEESVPMFTKRSLRSMLRGNGDIDSFTEAWFSVLRSLPPGSALSLWMAEEVSICLKALFQLTGREVDGANAQGSTAGGELPPSLPGAEALRAPQVDTVLVDRPDGSTLALKLFTSLCASAFVVDYTLSFSVASLVLQVVALAPSVVRPKLLSTWYTSILSHNDYTRKTYFMMDFYNFCSSL